MVWVSREEVCGLKNKFGGSGEEVRDLWKGLFGSREEASSSMEEV